MARKKKHEEHENHERWLVSYADFITLLFAFFVVMYAVSSVNEGKYRVLSESLVAAFRSPSKSISPVQIGQPAKSAYREQIDFRKIPVPSVIQLPNMPMPRPEGNEHQKTKPGKGGNDAPGQKALNQISKEVVEAMDVLIKKKLITVRRNKDSLSIEINSSILFPSGSATLSASAQPTLVKLAHILARFPNPIHVEGFTDDVPINNVIFRSNWELSAGRAASVVHLFTEHQVKPQRMVAIGYGEYRPIADNKTADGRRKNRRVVLVVQAGKTHDQKVFDSLKALAGEDHLPAESATAATVASTPASGPKPALSTGNSAPSAAAVATKPDVTGAQLGTGAAVDEPTRDAVLRPAAGVFPVIAPPIQLPFVPLGSMIHLPVAPIGAVPSPKVSP